MKKLFITMVESDVSIMATKLEKSGNTVYVWLDDKIVSSYMIKYNKMAYCFTRDNTNYFNLTKIK